MGLNEFLKSHPFGRFQIESLRGAADLTQRLQEMGFFPGVEIEIIGRLPFGGPWLIRQGTSSFALRLEEVSAVVVRKAA